jgi:N-acetylmuramoyl-L-alanine amidase
VIYLSAGHSNKDPGATAHGRREADILVEFRNIVSFYLSRAKVPHDMDGEGTDNLPLSAAIREVGRNRPAVEFHCNAAAPPQPKLVNGKWVTPPLASGVETLSAAKDLVLGANICKGISDTLGIRNRGAKPENAGQHHRLAFVQAGGIIVELFFITNPDDLRAYDERKWLAARSVAGVLMTYAGY